MNGIYIPKKKLTAAQRNQIKNYAGKPFKTKIDGYISFAKKADVSLSSIQKAIRDEDNELSEQIINKIIKAL